MTRKVKQTWRLTPDQRREMMYLYCWGEKIEVIAEKYDVTEVYVSLLAKRRGFVRKKIIKKGQSHG